MIATLKKRDPLSFYCSNCRMMQYNVKLTCSFCGAEFTNYADILIQMYEAEYEEIIKDEKNPLV